ncbi:MAG: peroxiredoxin [bacterium]|nr:peroxiredoxin [bacterium]
MPRDANVYELPENLPIPVDDGACDHLAGTHLSSVPLMSTAGQVVDVSRLPGYTVVYCYPRTGRPDRTPSAGWNAIPGARGCTPESCAFRDRFHHLQALSVEVFGLSTQDTADQQEAVERLHLPFALLSDAELAFTRALGIPTFEFDSMILIKRLTLMIREGRIEHVFYPIFPPDKHAEEVVSWLSEQQRIGQ